jgi:hypothetical protein
VLIEVQYLPSFPVVFLSLLEKNIQEERNPAVPCVGLIAEWEPKVARD